ncbi:MAG: CDP-diacylglycerol--glycerol-3-phosphate 3-phosphatidyltransferase [Planctomycetes bacterium]|nr:CDP-diacylglycerol--glycerol-3-phosphate 3-phosphatidyltransferase [Planctomycetota bacterium]
MADPKQTIQSQFLNVPNQLTTMRLVLSVIVFVLIPLDQYLFATVVFIVAASTDWVDGYWARRYGQVTKLGRVFDPFVDKIIICGTFIFLAAEPLSGIQAWMAVVVVGREMLVTTLRSLIEQSGGDFSAKMAGKLKMVFQCVAVVNSLLILNRSEAAVVTWLDWALVITVYTAILSTVYSGVEYVVAAARYLR